MAASTKPKRDLSDFFKPYARARVFDPAPSVPLKRPSPPPSNPSAENARSKRHAPLVSDQLDGPHSPRVPSSPPRPSTPPRRTSEVVRQSPSTPSYSAITAGTPGSTAQLPIRTPQSSRKIAAPVTYIKGPIFVRSPAQEQVTDASQQPRSSSIRNDSALTTTNVNALPAATKSIPLEIRDSDEDDSDSLASISDIFGKSTRNEPVSTSPPDEQDAVELEKERKSMLKLFLNGRSDPASNKKKLNDILALKTLGSKSTQRFLNRQRDYVESTRKVEQLRVEYETSLKEADKEDLPIETDAKLEDLEGFVEGEADAERLIGAVRRTEALSREAGYAFFGRLGMRNFVTHPMPVTQFPSHAVPFQLFRAWDDDMRTNQYLSGIMAQLAGSNQLKADALKWTFNACISEPNIALRAAYVNTLANAATYWVRNGIKPHDVQLCFYALAANLEEMADSVKFQMRPLPSTAPDLKPDHLVSTLDLFARIASHMSFESLSVLASIICQIAIDPALMSIASIASKVEDLFDSILARCEEEVAYHVASHLVSTVSQALQEPTLQARLLEHILPSSLLAINVRIRLAHLFLLGVPAQQPTFTASRPPPVDLLGLTHLLTTSDDFATARLRTSLNYTSLRARTILLDIAISDGGRPVSFPSQKYPRTRDFDQQIDIMAAAVRKVWIAISDTGATHMRRTEAKEKLDCLYQRLVHVVRTEPPPKKHIFDQLTGKYGEGSEMRAVARGRDSLKSFLARAEEARKSNDAVVKIERPDTAIDGHTKMQRQQVAEKQEKESSNLLSPPPPSEIRQTPSTASSAADFVDAVEHQLPSPSGNVAL